jgi:transcriptional regulator with XRE-family HTH domain
MTLDQLLDDPTFRRGYEVALLQARMADYIEGAIESSGLSKQEVARRMDVTPGRMSQIVSGGENLTLETIARVLDVLDLRLDPAAGVRDEEMQPQYAEQEQLHGMELPFAVAHEFSEDTRVMQPSVNLGWVAA